MRAAKPNENLSVIAPHGYDEGHYSHVLGI